MDRQHEIIIEVQDSPAKVGAWLDQLMQSEGADVLLDDGNDIPDGLALPVILKDAEPGNWVLLDISSARGLWDELQDDSRVRLVGRRDHKDILSSALTPGERYQSAGKTYCYVSYPEQFKVLVRRNAFRAEMRKGLECTVVMRADGGTEPLAGQLKDLSVTGCQVQFPVKAVYTLIDQSLQLHLNLLFPNGMALDVMAELRHHRVDVAGGVINAGFEFIDLTTEQSKSLWYFVREIEREFARGASAGRELNASALFERQPGARPINQTNHSHYATPMARLLASNADYISTLILALRNNEEIDPILLSRQADQLLALLTRDREGVLFGVHCINDQPPLVSHCLELAVRLADIARTLHMPHETVKAIAACGMVHDLGKALLNPSSNDEDEQPDTSSHVPLLTAKLTKCRWLSDDVIRELIKQVNERADGSGYPNGLTLEGISELGRLAAVVDTVATLRSRDNESSAMTAEQVATYFDRHRTQFDDKWCRFYFRHFGAIPIGSLVRFESGLYGWVTRLDDQRNIKSVIGTNTPMLLTANNLGEEITGDGLHALGKPREVIRLC